MKVCETKPVDQCLKEKTQYLVMEHLFGETWIVMVTCFFMNIYQVSQML